MVDFSGDVVFEILLRLPVTSIGRFKCVCKHWYDVIESREFMEHHYALQDNSTMVIADYSNAANIFTGKKLRVVEKNFELSMWSIFIASPCRGLFLLHRDGLLGLFNPTTKAFRLLRRMPNVAIPNDPKYFAYGLGWDAVTDDYKVVFFLYRHHQVAAIYSLNSDSWRLLDSPPKVSNGGCIFYRSLCYANTNGFCYWLPLYGNNLSLISFDVAQENFLTITLPPNVTSHNYTVLSTYYDSLALLTWEKNAIEVWVLQQEQQHYWTKAYSFRQTDLHMFPMGIWNNTRVLLRKHIHSNKLFMYDIENDHYEEKVTSPNFINLSNSQWFLNYRKSLFSVRGGSKDWIAPKSSNKGIYYYFGLTTGFIKSHPHPSGTISIIYLKHE